MIDQNVIKHDYFRFFDFDRNGYKNKFKIYSHEKITIFCIIYIIMAYLYKHE